MLCYKTDEKGQKVFGQISVDSKSIVDVGFFLNTFGDYMLRMCNGPCDPKNKFRIILDYDPENEKSLITFTFDEQESRFEIPPTKEAAEQASRERIKCLGTGSVFYTTQKRVSEEFCSKILEKIKKKANLQELNDMIRALSHFEATGSLTDAEMMNTIANKYLEYVEDYIITRGSFTGDLSLIINDSIRCVHRLNDILYKMRQETSHS